LLNIDTTQTSTLATEDVVGVVTSVAVSPRDDLVVGATTDGIYGWRLPDGRPLAKLAITARNDLNAIVFGGDGRFLFSAGRHGLLSVWAVNPASIDAESGFVKAADSGRVEWLGTKAVPAHCLMNEQLYPRQACEGQTTTTGLLRATLARPNTGLVDSR
jgi:WD40 repeat protein